MPNEDHDTQSNHDLGITQTCLDYVKGWFAGDAQRMQLCLHPELAKRAVKKDAQTGEVYLNHLTQADMVERTRQGGGTATPAEEQTYRVQILDHDENIACAKVETNTYIDYLHLAMWQGRWVIVNVLYDYNRSS